MAARYSNREEKYWLIRERLFTAAVADALDGLGFRHQTMCHDIRPLHPDFVVVGNAKTALQTNIYEAKAKPYVTEVRLLDSLESGDVLVQSGDSSAGVTTLGELFSTACKMRGSAGAVSGALVRDAKSIIALGFPVFSRGLRPQDYGGRTDLADFDVTVSCGGVSVHPGDLVFGDYDGVVVIPAQVEDEAIHKALEIVEEEEAIRLDLLQGGLISEVFRKHGLL